MGKHILVINPNRDRNVTAAMDKNLESLRFPGGPIISCETLEDAPPGIDDAQVTLENWRLPPFNRWAFQHVRELIPTATIWCGESVKVSGQQRKRSDR